MINTDKLNAYILDPSDPIKNYEVALEYTRLKIILLLDVSFYEQQKGQKAI